MYYYSLSMPDLVLRYDARVNALRASTSVARLSRANGKITDLLESLKKFSAHNDQICLRLSKIVTHVFKMVLD